MEQVNFETNDETIDITIDNNWYGKLEEASSFSTVSHDLEETDFSDDESSIKRQVADIHLLFTNQDLDMAKSDIESLKEELERNQDKLQVAQSQLREKDDDVAKIKLERDLASAEKNLLKQQFTRVVGRLAEEEEKHNDEFQHIAFHQFTPCFNLSEEWHGQKVRSDDGISNRLLSCWEGQENLNVQILKELGGKTDASRLTVGDRHRRPKFWNFLTLIFRSKVREGAPKKKSRVLKCFSIGKKWKNPSLKYYAVHDNVTITDDEESLLEWTDSVCNENGEKAETWLIDEILALRESSQKCIYDANQYMSIQAGKISTLQNELNHFMDMQMTTCSTSISEDELSMDSMILSDILGDDDV